MIFVLYVVPIITGASYGNKVEFFSKFLLLLIFTYFSDDYDLGICVLQSYRNVTYLEPIYGIC